MFHNATNEEIMKSKHSHLKTYTENTAWEHLYLWVPAKEKDLIQHSTIVSLKMLNRLNKIRVSPLKQTKSIA